MSPASRSVTKGEARPSRAASCTAVAQPCPCLAHCVGGCTCCNAPWAAGSLAGDAVCRSRRMLAGRAAAVRWPCAEREPSVCYPLGVLCILPARWRTVCYLLTVRRPVADRVLTCAHRVLTVCRWSYRRCRTARGHRTTPCCGPRTPHRPKSEPPFHHRHHHRHHRHHPVDAHGHLVGV